jgi:hypothetical protein
MSTKHQTLLIKIVFLIGIITILSGLTQAINPELVLSVVGGEKSPGGNHSFAIIGMFMVLFGALVIHALSTESQEPVAIFWCSLQKLGAAVAVGIGVSKGLFSLLALAVAGFDLLSFVVMYVFWLTIRKNQV